jgi:hypothetical protein
MLRGKNSAQWLSDRTTELGYTVTRSVISDLELGRRRYVSTAEITVLARALHVPPGYLLYPDLPDGSVEVLPNTRVRSIDALMWFSGELTYQPTPTEPHPRTGILHENLMVTAVILLVQHSRQQVQLQKRLTSLAGLAERLRRASADPSAAQAVTTEISAIWDEIKEINSELKASPLATASDASEDDDLGG